MKVALFITCLTDAFYPRTGIATVNLLRKLGHEVCFPQAQTCCGQPMFNNGFRQESRELAKRMIRTFEDYPLVITPSGSCAAMVRDNYPELFHGDPAWEADAQAFANKTYEFIEFLHHVAKLDLRAHGAHWPGKVTYHYSCHLRGIGITREAIDLLEQIQGLEFVPLDKADQCCGFGGTFALKYPQISGSLVRDKVQCIQNTHAGFVVSNDAGCTMNLSGSCRRQGVAVQFISLAEIIAESLDLLDRSHAPLPVTAV